MRSTQILTFLARYVDRIERIASSWRSQREGRRYSEVQMRQYVVKIELIALVQPSYVRIKSCKLFN
jgi:hypothetical protein